MVGDLNALAKADTNPLLLGLILRETVSPFLQRKDDMVVSNGEGTNNRCSNKVKILSISYQLQFFSSGGITGIMIYITNSTDSHVLQDFIGTELH